MKTTIKRKMGTPMVRLGGYALPETFEMAMLNDDDQPNVTARFRVRQGRVECAALTVEAQPDGREVQTSDFRAVRVHDWLEQAVQLAAAPIVSESDDEVTLVINLASEDRGAVREAQKARRKLRVTPERLREVAAIVQSSEDAVSAVMEALDVGQRAAQLWIKRARDHTDPDTGRSYLEPGKTQLSQDEIRQALRDRGHDA